MGMCPSYADRMFFVKIFYDGLFLVDPPLAIPDHTDLNALFLEG